MASEHPGNDATVHGAAKTLEIKAKRLYDGLTEESKERVTFLITRYHMLTTGDRDAFLQELGLITTGNVSAQYTRLTMSKTVGTVHPDDSERVRGVRERDAAFITMNTDESAATPAALHMAKAVSDEDVSKAVKRIAGMTSDEAVADSLRPVTEREMRNLLVPGLFGESSVSVRASYEPAEAGHERETEEERDNECGAATADVAGPADSGHCDTAVEASAAPSIVKKPCLLRSTAYQHLRLTHNAPAHLNCQASSACSHADHDDGKPMYNVTGLPLYESELRMWFDELDTDHTGTLDLDQFSKLMSALERDFGVNKEYNDLARKGAQLSTQGRLPYEAFAYLIMHFARA